MIPGTKNPTLLLTEEQALVLGARPADRAAEKEEREAKMGARLQAHPTAHHRLDPNDLLEAPKPKATPPMHPTARQLLLGSLDPASPLSVLGGKSDELGLIFGACEDAWWEAAEPPEGTVAYEHAVASRGGMLPPLAAEALNINMMPFVLGEVKSLPEPCHRYWPAQRDSTRSLLLSFPR